MEVERIDSATAAERNEIRSSTSRLINVQDFDFVQVQQIDYIRVIMHRQVVLRRDAEAFIFRRPVQRIINRDLTSSPSRMPEITRQLLSEH